MRTPATVLLCLLLLLGATAADETKAAKALTFEQAADAALAAVRAKDAAALKALAEMSDPYPWIVAEKLCARGAFDAATAFAKAAPRKAVEKLPDYVASQRGKEPDLVAYRTLASMIAAVARSPQAALTAAAAVRGPLTTVTRVRIEIVRGEALRALNRHKESAAAFRRAADGAAALGWMAGSATAHHETALSALRGSDWNTALAGWIRNLALARELGERVREASALGNIGVIHRLQGDYAQALAYQQRALALREELGDRAGVARAHGNIGMIHTSQGNYRDALLHQERARVLLEEVGDRLGLSKALGNVGFIQRHLGNYREALVLTERALALREELGDPATVASALAGLGAIHNCLGDHQRARSYQQRALKLSEQVGDRAGVAMVLGDLGNSHRYLGDFAQALDCKRRSLALSERLGDRAGVANSLQGLGTIHAAVGEYAQALDYHERSLALSERLGDRTGVTHALSNIGLVYRHLGEYEKALSFHERARAAAERIGDPSAIASVLGPIGRVYERLGQYTKALSYLERALALKEKVGDRTGIALCLVDIGTVHARLGEYARALASMERAMDIFEAQGSRFGAASTLGNLGVLHWSLGEYARALSCQERALAIKEDLGSRAQVALTRVNLGNAHGSLGNDAEALAHYESALEVYEEVGDRPNFALVLGNIGMVKTRLGAHAEARSCFERALALKEELGDRAGVARTLGNLGQVLVALGDVRGGVKALGRAVREARRLRSRMTLVKHLTGLGRVHLEHGEPGKALLAAREARGAMDELLGGLADEEGASARSEYARLFAVGALAATRLDDPAEALDFLENGRAGALLETLGGRQALRWTDLPADLRRREEEAEARAARARRDFGRALTTNDLRKTRKARRVLDEATERVHEVAVRVQRNAKRQAGLFYPRAATLEEIEGWLGPREALVLYGLCLDEALALVLRRDGERIVALGTAKDLAAACAALDASDPDGDPSRAIAKLKAMLVDPLDLGENVEQVLVSPEGPLCYVPWGAILEQRVAVTPSGTTHVLLLDEEREPGTGILALGDPDYAGVSEGGRAIHFRGRILSPLPATRGEVDAIGTERLLGADASEATFAERVKERARWRAVHFACHGLVDTERPSLSSLALSGSENEDGFLTALEVLRMEIPADLAVLSACDTAKGKVVKGEGIVGLTRAFMYAGAPRVLCSLWKVDDEATQALMIKFYELWNPRAKPGDPASAERAGRESLGAAAALKQAQAFVRGHEKWKHPCYWAAWVLWGLP